MPYSADGVYTPPTGAENASPSQIIRSATWNTIFTDLSSALSTVGNGAAWLNSPTTITSGPYTVLPTDVVVLVKGAVGTIALPLSSTKTPGLTYIMGAASTVFGSASAVVVPTSPETVNGAATLTLSSNFQVATFYALSTGGYIKF
jgi:hypothetical protein